MKTVEKQGNRLVVKPDKQLPPSQTVEEAITDLKNRVAALEKEKGAE